MGSRCVSRFTNFSYCFFCNSTKNCKHMQKRPHQQRGAPRAPLLLAFFCVFLQSLVELQEFATSSQNKGTGQPRLSLGKATKTKAMRTRRWKRARTFRTVGVLVCSSDKSFPLVLRGYWAGNPYSELIKQRINTIFTQNINAQIFQKTPSSTKGRFSSAPE